MNLQNGIIKVFIPAIMSFSSVVAQDFEISFAILGSVEKPATIQVKNLTQDTEMSVSGSDILNLTKDLPSGTDVLKADEGNMLQVYPNPMQDNAVLSFKNPSFGKVNISVVNTAGTQIAALSSETPGGMVSYEISGLNTGSYIVQVQAANYHSSCLLISQQESCCNPGIAFTSNDMVNHRASGEQHKLKSASETVSMQYNSGDVLEFTATLNTKNAKVSDYKATDDDEIEFSFTYTVTFKNWDYSTISTFEGEYGDNISYPAHPDNREGYIAGGWDAEDAFVPANDDLEITAQYEAISYNVTYNNVGTKNAASNPTAYTIETDDITLAAPSDSAGLTFTGWYTDAAFSDSISTPAIAQGSMGDVIFYAKWENIPLTDMDGNVYTVIAIGEQTWMAENLRTTKYNDGTAIPKVTGYTAWGNLSTPGFCWYINDSVSYAQPYGALYNWFTVNTGNLCPTGWHVPTDAEWTTLTTYLGGESVAGGKLKETGTTHWDSPNTGATNETGFTALPGGSRYSTGGSGYFGVAGYWWSATNTSPEYARSRNIRYDDSNVLRLYNDQRSGYSVRCVRNK